MEQAQEKTFYSPARGLCIAWKNGEVAIGEDGKARRVGERHIQFIDSGGQFGAYATRDPEEIAYLENRAKREPKDIYTFDEYTSALVPVEQKNKDMERRLVEQNQLMADLISQQDELKRKLAEAEEAAKLHESPSKRGSK
jgi:hypothetical protein